MSRGLFHPKNGKKCAFCKRWNGNANFIFKNAQVGYEYEIGVFGKCMKNGSNQPSTGGVNCRDYEPSVEANKLL